MGWLWLVSYLQVARFEVTSPGAFWVTANNVRRWLRFGIICPRASSLVERVMRELGRRLKKIAYGWSDAGITKVAKIILKRFSDIDAWEEYWAKRMNSIGNVVLTLWNVKCQHNT